MLRQFKQKPFFISASNFGEEQAVPKVRTSTMGKGLILFFNTRSFAVYFIVLSLIVQSTGFSVVGSVTNATASSKVTFTNTAATKNLRQTGLDSQQPAIVKPLLRLSKTYFANDVSDTTTGTPTSCADANNTDCSLRTAINLANTDGHPNPDIIVLTTGATYVLNSNLPATGNSTVNIPDNIYISSAAAYANPTNQNPFICPSQASAVTIKGATGVNGLILGNNDFLIHLNISNFNGDGVAISGTNNTITCSSVSNNSNNGISIASSGNKIGGIFGSSNSSFLTDNAEVLVSNNNGNGIVIKGAAALNNTVQNSNIVTNTLAGIVISATASSNLIGSSSNTLMNVISSNNQGGIIIAGTGTSSNNVQGNLIGTDISGNNALGNGSAGGINLLNGASNNNIGGYAGNSNLVSSNSVGIVINNSSNNTIQGNKIGVNSNGTAALGNSSDGLQIFNGASNNTIGGSAGLGNIISGNTGNGIALFDAGTNNNIIQGNLIGTGSDGKSVISNKNGISLQDGPANTQVGGTGSYLFNVISGNSNTGISLTGAITGTVISRNDIGTNSSGDYTGINISKVNIGNTSGIVLTSDSSGGPNNTSIFQNVIAFNSNEGIQVGTGNNEALTTQNQISQNSIYANAGGLGINIQGGANNNILAPIIASAIITPVNKTFEVSGTASKGDVVEVFLGSNSSTNSYQGITYFGTATADSNSGNFVISGTLPNGFNVPSNPQLVATGTNNNSTSKFSNPFAPFVISNVKVNPSSFNFTYTQGSGSPIVQTGTSQLTALLSSSNVSTTISYNSGSNWLSVTPYSDNINVQTTSPVTVTVTADATNLAASNTPYVGYITFVDNANPSNTATITVSLSVKAAPTPTPTTPSPTTTTPGPTVTTTPTPTPTPTPPAGTTYSYYLPFLANNSNGFTTFLAFQNNGTATANISLQYFDTTGTVVTTPATTCKSVVQNGECIADNPFATNSKGTGILISDQPLNVIVSEGTPYGGSAYTISPNGSNTLIAPFAINNVNNFITQLNLFNPSSNTVTATIQFYSITGTLQTAATQNVTLNPHTAKTFDQTTGGNGIPTGFYGWALIKGASGSQLVAQVLEQNTSTHFVAIANAQASPQSTLYAPAIFNHGYSIFTTGSNIINPNANPVSVTMTYYNLNGTPVTTAPFVIPAFSIQPVYQGGTSGPGLPTGGLPDPFTGAATITSSGGNVVVAVNEAGAQTSTGVQSGTYLAAAQGSNKVSLPSVANGGFGGFISGVTIFNTSSTTVTGSITYYNFVSNTNNGTPAGTPQTFTIAPNASIGVYQGSAAGLPSNFYGMAVVSTTNGPANSLIVTTNVQSPNYFYTYIEPNQ